MQINGIAHVQLTVNDLAASRAFWAPLLELFEMKVIFDALEAVYYAVGGRTGILLTPAAAEFRGERFQQRRVGLHHLCFRLRAREDVDTLHAHFLARGATIIHPPEEGSWAPGYYSLLVEDPDGIRVEANFVPGKGNLDPAVQLPRPVP
jgi:catechol 2,3-dioxygenase-like lactoylglutathione lyase family enzyme